MKQPSLTEHFLLYDKEIIVATTKNRNNYRYKNESMMMSRFVSGLAHPVITSETYEQYLSLPKREQDEIKDVGGFVGGALKNGSRRKINVMSRTLITLDVDFADKKFIEVVDQHLSQYAYTIYSTHKHCELKPRYRLILYPDRPMLSDEYQACVRRIADTLGFDQFDHTGLDTNRLMYYPSVSKDGDFYFNHNDADFISVDFLLKSYGSSDAWKDMSLLPTSSLEKKDLANRLRKQQDPLAKSGVVGAYCRVNPIRSVIESELSDVYRNEGDRYTFVGGSSSNGLVIYENKFAYSNHATDPICGETCNAFDLVRIHKYGYLDDGKGEVQTTKLPSYRAMRDYAMDNQAVKRELVKSQLTVHNELIEAFDDLGADDTSINHDMSWLDSLQTTREGVITGTFFNILLIMESDLTIASRLRFNRLSMRIEREDGELWSDTDSTKLRKYIGQKYVCDFRESHVEKCILEVAHKYAYHPIQDYLTSLTWDGIPRVDTLFIDYLKCTDNVYTREASRCWLVGAVNRAFYPSYKFDNVPVFGGDEGIGKSMFIELLAKGWFGTLKTFDDKKSVEQMSGRWIVEISELSAMSSSKVEQQKAFISETSTIIRAAYARHATEYKRQCVFAGTTNQHEYLISRTGNRRWWPIDCGLSDDRNETIDFKRLKEEVDQIWAESYMFYVAGASTLLSNEAKLLAKSSQNSKIMSDGEEGVITEWLTKPADADRYVAGYPASSFSNKPEVRDKVCINEIWQDCFNETGRCKTSDRRRIGYVLDSMANLERKGVMRFGDRFGRQRGWIVKQK